MVEYDPRKLVSHWLLERLTTENTLSKNQIKRPNLIWNTDPKLPTIFQPDERDYQTAKVRIINYLGKFKS
jgi:DNA/RNA endonuclease G (NUC1)